MVDRLKIIDEGNFFEKTIHRNNKRFLRKKTGKNDEYNNVKKFEFVLKIRLN